MSETLASTTWIEVGEAADFPTELGICIQHDFRQIAVFKLSASGEWFATQNLCPHEQRMVLSRGLTGDANSEPKITCPLHKRSFSLVSGKCLNDSSLSCLKTYPVKEEAGKVFVQVDR